jgi:GAF domain-containing protein
LTIEMAGSGDLADAVLQAIVDATVAVSAAELGWILALRQDRLHVVAAAGWSAQQVVGTVVDADQGSAGYVVSSGQPLAIVPRDSQPHLLSPVAAVLGSRPESVLSVPCDGGGSVSGVLEVVGKAGGERFSIDDLELATLLGGIAGVALDHSTEWSPAVPTIAELGAQLGGLADADPSRYAVLAPAISAMLRGG